MTNDITDAHAAAERRQRLDDIDCHVCENQARRDGLLQFWERAFLVCPDCGNKRCPRATWHGNPCSGSNAPGQSGSVYGVPPVKLDDPSWEWPDEV